MAVKKLDKETNKMLHVRFKEQEERAKELEEQEARYKNSNRINPSFTYLKLIMSSGNRVGVERAKDASALSR